MEDSTKRFIEDHNGNVIEVGKMALSSNNPMPIASTSDVNLRWLKDNVSGRFYPITSRSFILGGIGRGSSREIIDFVTYINSKYEGVFKLVTMAGHVKYYVLDLTIKTGTFAPGDNILTNPIPVIYYPQKHLVFESNISPDETSKITVYLSATDGRVHCFIDPRYEVLVDPGFGLNPILYAKQVTGVAAFIE